MSDDDERAITMDEYQERAMETAIYPGAGTITGLMYVGLGLGEAGEVQGKIKKIVRDAGGVVTEEAAKKIAAELGDLLWYVAMTATELGVSLDDVARGNLAKLANRQTCGVIRGDGDER